MNEVRVGGNNNWDSGDDLDARRGQGRRQGAPQGREGQCRVSYTRILTLLYWFPNIVTLFHFFSILSGLAGLQ